MKAFYLLVAVVVLVIVIAGPFWTIWALNLLFGLSIPITFKTWLAVTWLEIVLTASAKAGSKA